jgi:hypothetical protein
MTTLVNLVLILEKHCNLCLTYSVVNVDWMSPWTFGYFSSTFYLRPNVHLVSIALLPSQYSSIYLHVDDSVFCYLVDRIIVPSHTYTAGSALYSTSNTRKPTSLAAGLILIIYPPWTTQCGLLAQALRGGAAARLSF